MQCLQQRFTLFPTLHDVPFVVHALEECFMFDTNLDLGIFCSID